MTFYLNEGQECQIFGMFFHLEELKAFLCTIPLNVIDLFLTCVIAQLRTLKEPPEGECFKIIVELISFTF